MTPALERIQVLHGDNREVLKSLADNSIDAVVTDAPYGLGTPPPIRDVLRAWMAGQEYRAKGAGFMGREWDAFVPGPAVWRECFRVLKPGGHLLAFFGTRTYDVGAVAVRLAGFEVRDLIAWLYGSGFPKSLNVAKAIDKLDTVGPRRERALKFTAWLRATGISGKRVNALTGSVMASHYLTAGEQPEIPTRAMFDRLRPVLPPVPAWVEELITSREVESENLARREVVGQHDDVAHAAKWRAEYDGGEPAAAGLITRAYTPEAQAWEGWGTALKPALEPVVFARKPLEGTVADNVTRHGTGALNVDACRIPMSAEDAERIDAMGGFGRAGYDAGPGLSLSGSVDGSLNKKAEDARAHDGGRWPANVVHDNSDEVVEVFPTQAGAGGRASGPSLRGENHSDARGQFNGLAADRQPAFHADPGSAARFFYSAKADAEDRLGSKHPTVKPVDLMAWLCRLVTPPGGTILDPFAGSGTTGIAALREGFAAILVEREAEYVADIRLRLEHARGTAAHSKVLKARSRKPADAGPLFGAAE